MGRGTSKAGSLGGAGGSISITMNAGGATGSLPTPTNQVTPPTPQQVATGNVLPGGGVPFDQFMQMTDDQKADVINDALNTGVPLFLDDSGLQRFSYFTGMSDKPTVVSDAQMDKIKGTDLFRTVNDAYDSRKDIGYTANDIIKQISTGDFTMYSDSGGSAHGRGIYFADSYTGSTAYGNSSKSKVMRAKVTSGKSVSESRISSDYHTALNRGDKLARACSRADSASRVNLYALAKGYNVIDAGWGYKVVLNRGALTVSSKTKNATGGSW